MNWLAMLATIGPSSSDLVRSDPVGVGDKRGPFPFAFGKRLPGKKISHLLIGFPDQGGEEPGLPDAVLLPYFRHDRLVALQQRRQPTRKASVDPLFVDHLYAPQRGVARTIPVRAVSLAASGFI